MTDHWIAGVEASGRRRYQLFFTDAAGSEAAFDFQVVPDGYLSAVKHSDAFEQACAPYARAASELPQIVRLFRAVEYFGVRALALRPGKPGSYRLVLAGPDMAPFEGTVDVLDVDPRHPRVRVDGTLRGVLGGPFGTEESARVLDVIKALILRFDWQRAQAIDLALGEVAPDSSADR